VRLYLLFFAANQTRSTFFFLRGIQISVRFDLKEIADMGFGEIMSGRVEFGAGSGSVAHH
jgi:hypothetical protein